MIIYHMIALLQSKTLFMVCVRDVLVCAFYEGNLLLKLA